MLKNCDKDVMGCNCTSSWRNQFCSIEHYQQWAIEEGGVKPVYKLRAGVGTGNKEVVYDVTDYEVKNNTVELVTSVDGKILTLEDTEYLIVLGGEKENLLVGGVNDGEYVRVDKRDYKTKIKLASEESAKKKSDTSATRKEDSKQG
jgi:hypothetical protein